MCDDGREVHALHGKKTAAEHNLVLGRQEVLVVRRRLAIPPRERSLEQLLANVALNVSNSIVQALDYGLALQCLHSKRSRLSRHDDEGNDSHVGAGRLHTVVQASQRLNEHIHTLISVLVTSSSEEVESLVRVKIVVSIEVAADKIVDALLVGLVKVLELVGSAEFLHVQTVGQDTVRLTLEQVLTFVCSDVRDGGEDICRVRRTALYAITVVNASLASLCVHIEVLQVVVEIDGASAEVAAEEGSVGGEDGGHIDLALLTQGESNTRQPFVELCNNSSLLLVVDILRFCQQLANLDHAGSSAHLAQEPCNQIAEDDSFVSFMVIRRAGNASSGPQVTLPLIELVVAGAGVEQQHARRAVDQPAAVECLDASVVHRLDGSHHSLVLGYDLFNFYRGRSAVKRAKHGVVGAIFGCGDLSLGLEDGIDATDAVGNFGSNLEEDVVAHVSARCL